MAGFSHGKTPAGSEKHPAIVLLHSAGGSDRPVTEQYAKALSEAGFVALEPVLFRNAMANQASRPLVYMPEVFAAFDYLASRQEVDSDRIAVAGFSLGGFLALNAAAADVVAKFNGDAGRKFAAHAPFYPSCWVFTAVDRFPHSGHSRGR